LFLYTLIEKYIHILAPEMACSKNQHCANCIDTLSFPIYRVNALPLHTDTHLFFSVYPAVIAQADCDYCLRSVGSFVIKIRFAFLLVKMDLATDSGSEYDQGEKKIGFHFFLHV